MLPDGAIRADAGEVLEEFLRSQQDRRGEGVGSVLMGQGYESDSVDDEEGIESPEKARPWWRTPSPMWCVLSLFTISASSDTVFQLK
jgi:hypothetical protein